VHVAKAADVNSAKGDGRSPLAVAIEMQSGAAVAALLRAKANPDVAGIDKAKMEELRKSSTVAAAT
jgi:hypothetical protein